MGVVGGGRLWRGAVPEALALPSEVSDYLCFKCAVPSLMSAWRSVLLCCLEVWLFVWESQLFVG